MLYLIVIQIFKILLSLYNLLYSPILFNCTLVVWLVNSLTLLSIQSTFFVSSYVWIQVHEKISICMWYHNCNVALDVKDVGTINPLYNHAFDGHFFCNTNKL